MKKKRKRKGEVEERTGRRRTRSRVRAEEAAAKEGGRATEANIAAVRERLERIKRDQQTQEKMAVELKDENERVQRAERARALMKAQELLWGGVGGGPVGGRGGEERERESVCVREREY